MAKRKQVQDAEVAGKTIESKGLLIVNTGPGKGKSTAAFGLMLRALGHGWRVGVVQFVKGGVAITGERTALERFPDLVSWHTHGRRLHLGDAGPRPRRRRRHPRLGQGEGIDGRRHDPADRAGRAEHRPALRVSAAR